MKSGGKSSTVFGDYGSGSSWLVPTISQQKLTYKEFIAKRDKTMTT